MEAKEIEGKSIDEAIEKACSVFQVPREKLNIEIIAAGNPGFLGLGAKKALIRASRLTIDLEFDDLFSGAETPAPVPPEVRTAAEPDRSGTRKTDSAEEPVATAPKPPPTARPAATAPETAEKRPAPPEKRSTPKTEPQPAARKATPRPDPPPAQKRVTPDPEPAARKVTPRPDPLPADQEGEPAAAKAQRILEGILMRMQIPSPVDAEETDEAIVLNIRGDGSGLLIGKRGQNLDAIQYIVNKAVHHSANGHKMIVIDTEEYRKRREESLIALALRLAEKAKKTKKPVTVGHMNAHDRRVIHMAMQDDETLTTKSRGEGEYRKIVILPARRDTETPAG